MGKKDKARGLPDFWLTVAQEVKADMGEDSFCRCFCSGAGLLAVFDGCGGLGAQRHASYGSDALRRPEYANQTEAYMAARLCSGAFYDAFHMTFPQQADATGEQFYRLASEYCSLVLSAHRPTDTGVLGRMVKTLPTTAAAALVLSADGGSLICPIWAGDSRVYLLTRQGLAQLTTDDATVSDPMANLYDDGVLRNVLSASAPPQLNHRCVQVKGPFLVIAATDGCFGYFSTPMEFEGALLEALDQAANVDQWEEDLRRRIGAVAGDDFTLNLASYGFGSFDSLKQTMRPRLEKLREGYLETLALLPIEDRAARESLWAIYQAGYLRYMKDEK